MYYSNTRQLPGLNISAQLIVRKNDPTQHSVYMTENLDSVINLKNCSKFVPDSILRRIPRLRREKRLEDSLCQSRKVKLVDGSYAQLSSAKERLRPRPQLKYQEKRDVQISIRQMRVSQRLYSEIHNILALSIKDAHIKLPVWRLTRVQPSPDYRTCVAFWTIDDPEDHKIYYESLSLAFSNITSAVRHRLSSRLSFGFTPSLSFKYEDYSALVLAEAVSQLKKHEQ